MIILNVLAWGTIAAKAQVYTSDNKRIVRMGQSTSDFIMADGSPLTSIQVVGKSDILGWNLVYGGRCENQISRSKQDSIQEYHSCLRQYAPDRLSAH